MTYEELVTKVQKNFAKANGKAIAEHVAIEFDVLGEANGALYLEISDGKLDVEPFEYYDRDAIVRLSAADLLEVSAGKKNVFEIEAQIEGNREKVAKLNELTFKAAATKKAKEEAPKAKKAPAKKVATETKAAPKAPAKKATKVKAK